MYPLHPLPAILLLTSLTAAQVPPGHGIVARFDVPDATLKVFSPRNVDVARPLTNLPRELLRTPGINEGANCVKILGDGRVAAGNIPDGTGRPLTVWILTLDGLNVVAAERYDVGTGLQQLSGVNQLAELPDGRIAFATSFANTGPTLGLVDPARGTITPLAVTGLRLSSVNALTASDDGRFLFAGVTGGGQPASIYRIPLDTLEATEIATVTGGLSGIALGNDEDLWAACLIPQESLWHIDLATGRAAPVPGLVTRLGSVAVERSTGHLVVTDPGSRDVRLLAGTMPGSVITDLETPGATAGIDLAAALTSYGDGTPGTNTYRLLTRPNPGGLPYLGNTAFAITLSAEPDRPDASTLLLGPDRVHTTFFGAELLVDPATLAARPLFPARRTSIALPIPADASLAGMVLHTQTIHLDDRALHSSNGVTIRVVVP